VNLIVDLAVAWSSIAVMAWMLPYNSFMLVC
jgi:hypothetical protein